MDGLTNETPNGMGGVPGSSQPVFNMPPIPKPQSEQPVPPPAPAPAAAQPAAVTPMPEPEPQAPVIEIERGSDITAEIKAEQKKKREEKIGAALKKAEHAGKRIKYFFRKVGYAFRHNRAVQYTALALLLLLLIGGGIGLYIALKPEPGAEKIWIRFDPGEGVNQQIEPIEITVGENVFDMTDANGDPIVSTPLKIGSSFNGWTETQGGGTPTTTTAHLTSDTTLYAIWKQSTRMVILSVDDQQVGTVSIEAGAGGLTTANLNDLENGWIIPTDADSMGKSLQYGDNNYGIILENNYSDFYGWEYTDAYGKKVQLLFHRDMVNNTDHTWDYVYDGGIPVPIPAEAGEGAFVPPLYPTVMHAILEYRGAWIKFMDGTTQLMGLSGVSDNGYFEQKLGGNLDNLTYTLPAYSDFSNALASVEFSHWEIVEDGPDEFDWYDQHQTKFSITNMYPAAKRSEFERLRDKYYTNGEAVSLSPLLYYLSQPPEDVDGRKLPMIVFQAAMNPTKEYEMRIFSDTQAGGLNDVKPIPLNSGTPIYRNEHNIFLSAAPGVKKYAFTYVDDGVSKTVEFPNSTQTLPAEVEIPQYFNNTNSVIIDVYYETYERAVTANFNYGAGAVLLEDIGFEGPPPTRRIDTLGGAIIMMPSGESYVNATETFYGWMLEGDPKTIYYTGSYFTVPRTVTELNFIAVWRDPGLMFAFDLNFGDTRLWTPDTTSMKGDPGAPAYVTEDKPLRLGYDFVNWWIDMDGDGAMTDAELFAPGAAITVPEEIQFLVAQWTPKTVSINFQYDGYYNGNILPGRILTELQRTVLVDDETTPITPEISEYLRNRGYLPDGTPLPAADFYPHFYFKGWTLNGKVYIPNGLEAEYEEEHIGNPDSPLIEFNEDGVEYRRGETWLFTADLIAQILGYDAAIHTEGEFIINIPAYQPGKLVHIVYNIPRRNANNDLLNRDVDPATEEEFYDFYIPEGEKFFDHKPWKIGRQVDETTTEYYQYKPAITGYEFVGWTQDTPDSSGWGTDGQNIPLANLVDADTIIPKGSNYINLYAVYRMRRFTVEYRGTKVEGNTETEVSLGTDNNNGNYYSILTNFNIITLLPQRSDVVALNPSQNFLGWSTEKDTAESNPSQVYLASKSSNPTLAGPRVQFDNRDYTNDSVSYTLNIERRSYDDNPGYANYDPVTDLNTDSGIFHLVFYAVFATSSISISYDAGLGCYDEQDFSLGGDSYARNVMTNGIPTGYAYNAPIYTGNSYITSQTGGSTVGPKNQAGFDLSLSQDIDTASNRKALIEHGVMIGDDRYFYNPDYNFIGWKAVNISNHPNFTSKFPEGKIWFPGEYMPSVNFDMKFQAIWAFAEKATLGNINDMKRSAENIQVLDLDGVTKVGLGAVYTYKIMSVADDNTTIGLLKNITVEDGERLIIAISHSSDESHPTVLNKGALYVKENGSGKVARILLPSRSAFKLAAGSIIANSLTELYISDNLTGINPVTGETISQVPNVMGVDEDGIGDDDVTKYTIGGSLRRYVVRRGITSIMDDAIVTNGQTEKYYYVVPRLDNSEQIITNSLVSRSVSNPAEISYEDRALIAVPSGMVTNFRIQNELITVNLTSRLISRIKSYAFTNIKTKELMIDLNDVGTGASLLIIEDNAIYHSNANFINLPNFVTNPAEQMRPHLLSGYHPNLSTVQFAEKSDSSYAFVADNILYYGGRNASPANVYIMYVLCDAIPTTRGSTGKGNVITTLNIPGTVKKINDYALSCIDFGRIESITFEDTRDRPADQVTSQEDSQISGLTFKIFGITTNPHSSPFRAKVGDTWEDNWEKWQRFPIFVNEANLEFYADSQINGIDADTSANYPYAVGTGEYAPLYGGLTLYHTQTFDKKINIQKFDDDNIPAGEGAGDDRDENIITEWGIFEYGEVIRFFNPELEGPFINDFNRPYFRFGGWAVTGFDINGIEFVDNNRYLDDVEYISNRTFKVGMLNVGMDTLPDMTDGMIYINSSVTLVAKWDEYPLQFAVIDPTTQKWTELDVNFTLRATDDNVNNPTVTLNELARNGTVEVDVSDVYMPALPDAKYAFKGADGFTYRFMGWRRYDVDQKLNYGTDLTARPNETYYWRDGPESDPFGTGYVRYFPTDDVTVAPDQGIPEFDLYNHSRYKEGFGLENKPIMYFALYEASTTNYHLESMEGGYYEVDRYRQLGAVIETSVMIPYAQFKQLDGQSNPDVGYMQPIAGIRAGAFSYIEAITEEISIGGAVLIIGDNAFRGTYAKKLTFTQKAGDDIFNTIVEMRPPGANEDAYTESVLKIGNGAFAHSVDLEGTVFLPYFTAVIGASAFTNNYKLQEVLIGDNGDRDGLEENRGISSLTTVGNKAFAYCTDMTVNDVGNQKVINKVTNFGSGVFMGSGKIINAIVRNNINDSFEETNALIHAGQTNQASSIEFAIVDVNGDGDTADSTDYGGIILAGVAGSAGGILRDEKNIPVKVDIIETNAFAFAEYVNYIKIGPNVKVRSNAFYMLGEQLQYIDLTTATLADIDPVTGDLGHAFSYMSFCPLYIPNTEFELNGTIKTGPDSWAYKFPDIAHWFRPQSAMPLTPAV